MVLIIFIVVILLLLFLYISKLEKISISRPDQKYLDSICGDLCGGKPIYTMTPIEARKTLENIQNNSIVKLLDV